MSQIITCGEEEFQERADNYDGVCLACGTWTFGGVEPDASGYPCEECGADKVMGAEEALLMGKLDLVED